MSLNKLPIKNMSEYKKNYVQLSNVYFGSHIIFKNAGNYILTNLFGFQYSFILQIITICYINVQIVSIANLQNVTNDTLQITQSLNVKLTFYS